MSQNKITFDGRMSGDGECFLWGDVPPSQVKAITVDFDPEFDSETMLAPYTVLSRLGYCPYKLKSPSNR